MATGVEAAGTGGICAGSGTDASLTANNDTARASAFSASSDPATDSPAASTFIRASGTPRDLKYVTTLSARLLESSRLCSSLPGWLASPRRKIRDGCLATISGTT